jgi:CheY-like chemotaxis protein
MDFCSIMSSEDMGGPSTPRILVVDDERSVGDSIALLLRSQGYEVTTAIDGFDALMQVKRAT